MSHSVKQLFADLEWLLCERESFVIDIPLAKFLLPTWPQKLQELKANPHELMEHMASAKSHFLGTYFEQLFSFVIQHFSTLRVIAEHQQIHVDGKTYGEVDLLAELQGKVYQFEIALKFYLYRSDLMGGIWIGPNKNDNLHKKESHARNHQLKILTINEGKEWLTSVSKCSDTQKNLMIYGRHFYPLKNKTCNFFAHSDWHGGWIRLSDLYLAQPFLSQLCEANKPYWITANSDISVKKQINNDLMLELSLRFRGDERPVLFSCVSSIKLDSSELFWLFVCPDDW
ncbi:DUF1853 family protein [Marinomonas ostreistagni]|uniref:DUF1853 family protein n=1 Tax=Marinomonas ostreistagni TaxID=359209 RepID=A0ABS0Z9X7_9GAMM|nr:DUF1853 family protein [Marinomonas ostreistagni]MBJ7550464.1 DUF1853 family protein [Marinomonas ostreistagni]